MTRSVVDAAMVLGVIAGQDPADETSLAAPVEDYAAAAIHGVKGIRIGLDERYIDGGAAPDVTASVLDAVRTLERLGARVVKVTVPDVEPSLVAWTTICASETLAAHAATFPARASEYGPGFRSFLELGTTIRGQDYANAHMVRERFANHFQSLFDQIDVLACPSMASRSVPANSFPADAGALSGPNPLLRFTGPFNLSRNPTLSQPCGDSSDGPPPSLQLVGRRLGEATLIQTGAAYEHATEWHKQHPPA
jgi:amidase